MDFYNTKLERAREAARRLEQQLRARRVAMDELAVADALHAGLNDLDASLSIIFGLTDVSLAVEELPPGVRGDIEGIRRCAAMAKNAAGALRLLAENVDVEFIRFFTDLAADEHLDVARAAAAHERLRMPDDPAQG